MQYCIQCRYHQAVRDSDKDRTETKNVCMHEDSRSRINMAPRLCITIRNEMDTLLEKVHTSGDGLETWPASWLRAAHGSCLRYEPVEQEIAA